MKTTTILLASLVGLILAAAGVRASPPNLIVILTDDQGYADVGFHGCTGIPTPHLDAIAANRVHFPNGYMSYAVGSPSCAGLLTGCYEQRFGHERNPAWQPANSVSGLPLTETLPPAALAKVGYTREIVVKWHLDAYLAFHLLQRGFNEFFGHLGGGHRYMPKEFTIKDTVDAKDENQSNRLWIMRDYTPVRTTQYLTGEFSDEAVRFVKRHKDGPFFLYLAYNVPPAPLQATEKYLARVSGIQDPRRRTYAAMISAVDDGVGRLMTRLRELHLERNTLVVYLSDNRGPLNDNAPINRPLRGAKGSPWEGSIRVPFAAQWPSHIPRGLVHEHPVIYLDIFATIAALARAPLDPARPLDGVNLVPYLTGEKNGMPHEAAVPAYV